MIGHIGIDVPDLVAAKRYYDALVPALGFEPYFDDDQIAYRPAGGRPGTYLFVNRSSAETAYRDDATGLQHLAFMVKSRSAVLQALALAESLGSEILIAPREFPQYPPPYFAGFWRDPHGFKLEAVCHYDRE